MKQKKRKRLVGLFLIIFMISTVPAGVYGQGTHKAKGQTLYVPVYSHIYSGDKEQPFYLSATLSIRNTDPDSEIMMEKVAYHDTKGNFLKAFITGKVTLKPLETLRYVISESDTSGGSGAKFIVKWRSLKNVTPPLIESVMISTRSKQGISFTSRAVVIAEY